jgi:hypothetical protein
VKDLNAVFSSLMFMQLFNTLFALCTFAFDVSTVSRERTVVPDTQEIQLRRNAF